MVDIKKDERNPEPAKRMTKKDAQKIVDAYKQRCERFPARKFKWEQKKDRLQKWVDSLPEK